MNLQLLNPFYIEKQKALEAIALVENEEEGEEDVGVEDSSDGQVAE